MRVMPRIAPPHRPRTSQSHVTRHTSQVARESVAMTRRIMSAAALKPYNPVEIVPGIEVGGDDERLLDKAISDIGTTIFHPVGTCR